MFESSAACHAAAAAASPGIGGGAAAASGGEDHDDDVGIGCPRRRRGAIDTGATSGAPAQRLKEINGEPQRSGIDSSGRGTLCWDHRERPGELGEP